MEKKAYLEIAKIINTHGVRGDVKLEPWCDSPDMFKKIPHLYLESGKEFAVSGVKLINGGFVVLHLSDIMTVEDAMKLKNKILFAKREDIPVKAGSHFICDIVGLPCVDAESGKVYGILKEVSTPALQEIYTIQTESGKEVMIPAVPAYVHHIDDNAVYLTPIHGFFDDDAEEVH